MKWNPPLSAGNVVARGLKLPPGIGLLFDRLARRQLVLAVTGFVFTALLEVVALAALLPLMQLLTSNGELSGRSADVAETLGLSTGAQLAGVFAGLVIGAYVLKASFTVAFRWWWTGAIANQQVATSTKIFRYYTRAPYSFHLRRTSSDLVSTASNSVEQVYTSVVGGSLLALAEMVTITAVAATLIVLAPIPAVLAIVFFGVVTIAFQFWVKPRLTRIGEEFIEALTKLLRSAVEAIESIKEVQVRGSGEFFEARYSNARMAAAQAARRRAFLTELPKHVVEVLFILGIGLLAWIAFARDGGADAIAIIALFAAAGFRILPSVVRAMAAFGGIRSGQYPLNKVLVDIRAANLQMAAEAPPGPRLGFSESVALKDVTFRYGASGPDVLKGVTLEIPFGSSVALVGGSGAGKSTLVDLVLGLLDPTEGSIEVDGHDILNRHRAWQDNIGLVPQSVSMLDGTVSENVALANVHEVVDDGRVWQVLRAADLEGVVAAMPGNIRAEVGERGVRFSGGQKQRIGIARALYRRPRILVLDEATSALDNITERKITDTIADLHGSMTTLIVAHRLSTVRHCDQIVFMANGRIVDQGNFEELRSRNSEFAHLVQLGDLT